MRGRKKKEGKKNTDKSAMLRSRRRVAIKSYTTAASPRRGDLIKSFDFYLVATSIATSRETTSSGMPRCSIREHDGKPVVGEKRREERGGGRSCGFLTVSISIPSHTNDAISYHQRNLRSRIQIEKLKRIRVTEIFFRDTLSSFMKTDICCRRWL